MDIIVERTGDSWSRFTGAPRSIECTVSVCTISYADGRVEVDRPCEPYAVFRQIDPVAVFRLVADGVWNKVDLAELGLRLAVPFVLPDGKRTVGAETFSETNGIVSQNYEIEDIPHVEPDPPPTVDQRFERMLADYGLTRDELRIALAPEAP